MQLAIVQLRQLQGEGLPYNACKNLWRTGACAAYSAGRCTHAHDYLGPQITGRNNSGTNPGSTISGGGNSSPSSRSTRCNNTDLLLTTTSIAIVPFTDGTNTSVQQNQRTPGWGADSTSVNNPTFGAGTWGRRSGDGNLGRGKWIWTSSGCGCGLRNAGPTLSKKSADQVSGRTIPASWVRTSTRGSGR